MNIRTFTKFITWIGIVTLLVVSSSAISEINHSANYPECLNGSIKLSRITQKWGEIISRMNDSQDFSVSSIQQLSFSTPENTDFGTAPDNEFFNPEGKFKAEPIPQEVMDSLTTIKGTRPLFNIRAFHLDDDGAMGFPIYDFMYLYVIIPNAVPNCLSNEKRTGWSETRFQKGNIIAPDNRTVVNDGKLFTKFIEGKDGKRYYLESFGPDLWPSRNK